MQQARGPGSSVAQVEVEDRRGPPTHERLRVLHVVEALAGGVATALEAYVRLTPSVEHIVLAHRRLPYYTRSWLEDSVTWESLPPRGHVHRIRAVTRAVRTWRPDVVHAHSSLAGGWVRVAPGLRRATIVYTPHCYAFERRDISAPLAQGFRAVEALLARRTGHVLANGPREERLARSLHRRASVTSLLVTPWLADGPAALPPVEPFAQIGPLRVAVVGRAQPQKGVDFLIAAARLVHAAAPGAVNFTWVGTGEPAVERLLGDAGVIVTGWLPRRSVVDALRDSDVYVHTAAWEAGWALSLLEAAQQGLPVVVRDIPAVADLPLTRVESPAALARQVLRLRDVGERRAAAQASRSLVARLRASADAGHLHMVYERLAQAAAGSLDER